VRGTEVEYPHSASFVISCRGSGQFGSVAKAKSRKRSGWSGRWIWGGRVTDEHPWEGDRPGAPDRAAWSASRTVSLHAILRSFNTPLAPALTDVSADNF
jgi:hypothetical protein